MVRQLASSVHNLIVTSYACPVRTRNHIKVVYGLNENLIPKTDTVTFKDGTSKELVCLDGTIPVLIQGTVYNIPICIWIPDTYPVDAPICYVAPTPHMAIEVSEHVSKTGLVNLPCLNQWNYSTSNLRCVVELMQNSFSESSPLTTIPSEMAKIESATVNPDSIISPMSNSLLAAIEAFMLNRFRKAQLDLE